MKVRWINQNDYEQFLRWWKWFRFPAPSIEFLPENGLGGLVVSKDDMDICAGFLYLTNSKIAWIEYIVSNPDYRSKDRTDALKILIQELVLIGIERGYECFYTTVKNLNLINHFKDVGFLEGTSGSTEMIYIKKAAEKS